MDSKITMLKLTDASVAIRRTDILNNLNMRVEKGESVGIYGLNGSGKSLLAELLAGRLKPAAGERFTVDGLTVAVVSSAEKKKLLEEELHNDDSEFMEGRVDPGRSVSDILKASAGNKTMFKEINRFAALLGIERVLERGIKFLSTGEFRKMLIAAAMMSAPDILVLDDPYTGLDIQTRRNLAEIISELKFELDGLVIISGRLDDVRDCSRLYFLNGGSLSAHDSAEEIKKLLSDDAPKFADHDFQAEKESDTFTGLRTELIKMIDVKMSYYETRILNDINWSVYSGEHWQIKGPNGSGKSSLLSLVNGDNPKAYGQEISLFGVKRGSGETIWEIKQRIGYVSGALQQQHRIRQNVLSVVVSGFFDTVGLYDKPDPVQIEKARGWCHEFGIGDYLELPFSGLSEGKKRAVLIIRAIVKRPEVLILDEPCQGLDDYNSEFVIRVAQRVISRDHSTLIYVSHDPYYQMDEITNVLELIPHPAGGFTARSFTN